MEREKLLVLLRRTLILTRLKRRKTDMLRYNLLFLLSKSLFRLLIGGNTRKSRRRSAHKLEQFAKRQQSILESLVVFEPPPSNLSNLLPNVGHVVTPLLLCYGYEYMVLLLHLYIAVGHHRYLSIIRYSLSFPVILANLDWIRNV